MSLEVVIDLGVPIDLNDLALLVPLALGIDLVVHELAQNEVAVLVLQHPE